MRLKRKIMKDLVVWAQKIDKKSLLLVGARQVGKSFIVKEFAEEYFKRKVYINFEENPEMKEFFNGSLSPNDIINKMRLHISFKEVSFDDECSILFIFDEIQACPNAITALKFFSEQKYSVIGTGSLLGVSLRRISSYPVGYVEMINIYPLDFEEFLWANNIQNTDIIASFINSKDNIPNFVHEQYIQLFKQYMIVGGMPEVVKKFVQKQSYDTILELQRQIIMAYKMDIAKYSDDKIKVKTRDCFESIPFQLAKDNKKFQYKYVASGGRSKDYDTCLNWLIDAGIIYKCTNLSTIEQPLKGYSIPNVFKVYFFDTGLLISMLDEGTSDKIMNGNLKIYKGAIYENIVANILKMTGQQLYYYNKDSKWEIDFILNINGDIIPLEIKSADNTKSKSLDTLMMSNNFNYGIKSSSNNIKINNEKRIISLPLYLLPFLKQKTKSK